MVKIVRPVCEASAVGTTCPPRLLTLAPSTRHDTYGILCAAMPPMVRLCGTFTVPDGEIESVTLVRLHPIAKNSS